MPSVAIEANNPALIVTAPAASRVSIVNNTVQIVAQSQTLKTTVLQAVARLTVFQQGVAGPPGIASTTVIVISVPALTWTLNHGLNRYPVPVLIDSAGDVILTQFAYLDRNTILVTFGAPTAGIAYIN